MKKKRGEELEIETWLLFWYSDTLICKDPRKNKSLQFLLAVSKPHLLNHWHQKQMCLAVIKWKYWHFERDRIRANGS